MPTPILALESGEKREDPHLATFGVLTLAVVVIVAFGGLLGAWLSLRSGTAVWPPKGVKIENYYGTTLSITMIMAMLAAEWAAYGVRRRERSQAIAGFAMVLLLGVAFLNLLSYQVHVSHFGPGTHPYGAVFFAFSILMGSVVLIALGVDLVAFLRLLGGQVSEREPALARSTAWLVHTAAIGWFVMYAAVYVVK
jgi:heme/copper-type cytochrome/quinol oxidase subunit 3